MIASFRHKGLKRLYEQDDSSKLAPDLVARIADLLAAIDAAESVEDLDRPSFRLHQLKGDRKGQWAITVRANWRIVFRFEGRDAVNVDLVDYH